MNARFFDRQDNTNPLNGSIIQSGLQLSELLNSYREREPFLCELEGENGYKLLIGVGPVGCVQFRRSDGSTPYLMAVIDHAQTNTRYAEFLIENTATPISTRYALPFDVVEQVAAYFLNTGNRSPAVSWEEI